MKTIIRLDILGEMDKFEKVFDIVKYDKNRRSVFNKLICFSMRPEVSAARESIQQSLKLPKEVNNENAKEVESVYNDIKIGWENQIP